MGSSIHTETAPAAAVLRPQSHTYTSEGITLSRRAVPADHCHTPFSMPRLLRPPPTPPFPPFQRTTPAQPANLKATRNSNLECVGNALYLHTNTTSRALAIQLDGKSKVHGIKLGEGTNSDKLLVYGEKEFMLLQWLQQKEFKVLYRAHLTDWISSAAFLEIEDEFVLLTAHSVLMHLRYSSHNANQPGTCEVIERSSCTDKSTLYCGHISGCRWHELIVFGGNAFGELLIWQPSHPTALLLQRISAHNGVIFSIDFCVESCLLTTTSDDRSVRIWKVASDTTDWSARKVTAAASGYGHVARVFKGKIIAYEGSKYVITVGEDSFVGIWSSCGELIHKRRQQFGAVIWNLDYDEESKILYTVGSTGNLLPFNLSEILESVENTSTVVPAPNPHDESEFVAKIKFLTGDLLVGVTSRNNFIYKKYDVDRWSVCADFTSYKCTVLEAQGDLVVLGGYKRLTILKYDESVARFSKLHDIEIMRGIIRAFQFLDNGRFLISDEFGDCQLLIGEDLLLRYEIVLPKGKERWVTSALMVDDGCLLVSNRQGHVMFYKLNESRKSFELKATLKNVHGNLGATVIKAIAITRRELLVATAGHDGALKLLCIDKIEDTLRMYFREPVPIGWVEFVETLGVSELLLGFNDNHFVVWSKEHDFVVQVPCGGGHRQWHYAVIDDPHTHRKILRLAFVKNRRLIIRNVKLLPEEVAGIELPPRNKWHVKPCNVLDLVKRGTDHVVLFSAGDDNLIKISSYDCASGVLRQEAEIAVHISNVRALRTYRVDDNHCLIFSGGGRAQMCVSKLSLTGFRVEQLVNYSMTAARRYREEGYSIDPETRIMAIDVLATPNSSEIFIFVGCSDGFLRKLSMDKNFMITFVDEIAIGKCVLQVRLVADRYVLVGSTDGRLTFYDVESMKIVGRQLSHHASGLNAIDVAYESSSRELQVITGGDDQSVAYTKLALRDGEPFVELTTWRLPHLHSAQVTAVALANDGCAYTSGVDQSVHRLRLDTGAVVGFYASCVADIKGIRVDTWDGVNTFFIYGCGLQIYRRPR